MIIVLALAASRLELVEQSTFQWKMSSASAIIIIVRTSWTVSRHETKKY